MAILHPNGQNFDEIVEKSDLPVLVDFYADWCGPCKMIAPILDQVAKETEGKAVICKVNVDEHEDLARRFGVMTIPTLLVYKNGEYTQSVGAKNKAGILSMLF